MRSQAVDDVLCALADEYRRVVVRYLVYDADGVASYREIAEHVASQNDSSPMDVRINLEHTTLPILAETDLVEYDPETEVIQYQSNAFVEDVLNSIDGP